MIFRFLFLVALLAAMGWALWGGTRAATDRMEKLGIGLTIVGAISTAVAWWMFVPEVILIVGLALLAMSRVRGRRVA